MSARLERIVLALVVCVPVPAVALSGLTVPLPGIVERAAAALVPWTNVPTLDAHALAASVTRGSIVLDRDVEDASPEISEHRTTPRRPARTPLGRVGRALPTVHPKTPRVDHVEPEAPRVPAAPAAPPSDGADVDVPAPSPTPEPSAPEPAGETGGGSHANGFPAEPEVTPVDEVPDRDPKDRVDNADEAPVTPPTDASDVEPSDPDEKPKDPADEKPVDPAPEEKPGPEKVNLPNDRASGSGRANAGQSRT